VLRIGHKAKQAHAIVAVVDRDQRKGQYLLSGSNQPRVDQAVSEDESPTFASGAFVTASSATAVTEDANGAEEFVAEYESLVRCYEEVLLASFESTNAGADFEAIPFYEVDFPSIGERRAAWTMQVGASARSLFVDLILVQRDRGLFEVAVLNDGSLSVEDEAAFVSSAVERMPGG